MLDKDTKKMVERTNYQIADYEDMPSGLMYTCDEFPFATTIQGGIGLGTDANAGLNFAGTTYCAPQSSACGKNTEWFDRWASDNPASAILYRKAKLKGVAALRKYRKETRFAFPKSDQDFQAAALNEISVSASGFFLLKNSISMDRTRSAAIFRGILSRMPIQILDYILSLQTWLLLE